MYRIHKLSDNPTMDFAAEELKKYLRMMMPRCGEIPIDSDAGAEDGFRLGFMDEMGLDISDAERPELDDIVYIKTGADGGCVAGSNPAALLIAVYRYLRFCGCRWLFPGTDGEWIPTISTLPEVNYRKLADLRYRGQCNEGAEFQQDMLDSIAFSPKIGLNTYMLEFDLPSVYYQWYYNHKNNTALEPEPLTPETVLQWKRECEVEIQKRGMHFHDMGHGWTAEPFGINSSKGWEKNEPPVLSEKTRGYLAEIGGVRDFFHNIPINTNICMSNPEARRIMAKYIADYAEKQNNVDFLHIWLADSHNNHCECENCAKKTTSDWYVILLNDIDAELTARGLRTHLVFIAYTDTFWAPKEEKLNNTERFTMLYAPIYRTYLEDYGYESDPSAVTEYKRNANKTPKGMSECLGYLESWKKLWKGDCFCYEYHFWKHQTQDFSGLRIADTIYKDIHGLKKHGLMGIVEDGSQRSFFPTGFAFYTYGEAMFDENVSFEELKEDYFSHAFGEKWRDVLEYLENVAKALPFEYFEGNLRANTFGGTNAFYSPDIAEKAALAPALADGFEKLYRENRLQPKRAALVSWKLLYFHSRFVRNFGRWTAKIADNELEGIKDEALAFQKETSLEEIYFDRCYDHYQFWNFQLRGILRDAMKM